MGLNIKNPDTYRLVEELASGPRRASGRSRAAPMARPAQRRAFKAKQDALRKLAELAKF